MFVSRIRAADGQDRSPFGEFWFQPLGLNTASGARVTSETALQLSAVFRAVTLISGHIAMLPLVLRQNGTKKRLADHPLYRLFKRPNRWQNGLEWRQMLTAHLLLRGNAYNEIIDNARGEILELIPLHPDRTQIEKLPSGDWRYRVSNADGSQRYLMRGQVWHLRGMSSNGITGVSVIECARESFGLGISAQSYGARFFANDAKPAGGWISFPGKFADRVARENFRESVQSAQGAANRGKIMVLDHGMEYHEVGINNKDSQFLESRKFHISDIARWFGVPPHKLADLERATFSNIEQQSLEYINDCLLIWAEIWEAGIEDVLLYDHEDLEAEFNFAKLLRGDSTARYGNYTKGIAAGWLTRNEARDDDGREPLHGLDEPLRPLNMIEESDAEDQEDDVESSEPPAQEAKEPKIPEKQEEQARRLRALIECNAGRLARRMLKSGAPADIDLIAESLAVPHADVCTWARETLWTKETYTEENLTRSLASLALQAGILGGKA